LLKELVKLVRELTGGGRHSRIALRRRSWQSM